MKKTVNTVGESTAFACASLPKGYELYKRIDLTKERSTLVAISIWSLVAALAMILPMLFVHPLKAAFSMGVGRVLFCIAAMLAGLAVYALLHEGVHGIFIRIFSGTSASFGLEIKKGMAYAGSSWYFKKWPYIIIALAPLVIWGVVLTLLLGDIGESYFWYLYGIQIFNVTGAAGDIYVSCEVARMPKEVLAHDSGMAMNFYLPAHTED